ncbi:hypothetical protein M8818_000607 [Zalaria obscura]|uniref:Uncharacterized protein n=1 Tax=Zalaria obscura TaxID=2024903 RepID=A0ACC3SQN1_9PEZI
MCVLDIIHAGAKVMLLEKGSKEPTQVEIPANEAVDSLPHPAQNVGRLYEAFADGKTEEYADWKLGRRRHELIAEMFQRSDGEEPFGAKASYMDQS